MTNRIRLAMVGTGIFARDAYLPALQNLADRFEIVAVCSRSQESVERFSMHVPHTVDLTTDYDALLTRPDIDAVCIVVPIATLPGMVEAALRAKKHVISEKPASPDVAAGRKLLAVPRESVWMVAENWRYGFGFLKAAEWLQGSSGVGRPILGTWTQALNAPGGKYYSTEWRRNNSFPGGFLLDGGVHHIAALRMMLGEVAAVSAFTTQVREDLPPADTLTAALRFENGCLFTYNVTYAVGSSADRDVSLIAQHGTLKVHVDHIDISTFGGGDHHLKDADNTIEAELTDFADAIQHGKTPRATPEQAVQDVAIIEAMLRAAENGAVVNPERIV